MYSPCVCWGENSKHIEQARGPQGRRACSLFIDDPSQVPKSLSACRPETSRLTNDPPKESEWSKWQVALTLFLSAGADVRAAVVERVGRVVRGRLLSEFFDEPPAQGTF